MHSLPIPLRALVEEVKYYLITEGMVYETGIETIAKFLLIIPEQVSVTEINNDDETITRASCCGKRYGQGYW